MKEGIKTMRSKKDEEDEKGGELYPEELDLTGYF